MKGRMIRSVLFFHVLITLMVAQAFAQNQPPIADAGPDQNVYTRETAVLRGSAIDPDGNPIIAWGWAVVDAPYGNMWSLAYEEYPTAYFNTPMPGDYIIALRVSDVYYDSAPDYVTIHVADNLPPVAIATTDKTSGPAPLTVCFDGSQSYDPEGAELLYDWNLGDEGVVASTAVVCHTDQWPGIYTVTFAVVDVRGAADVEMFVITAQEPANRPPTASPTATPNSGDAPLPVQFAVNASDPDVFDPLTCTWDFGDPSSADNTSTFPNPTHTYALAGTYTAQVTVSDGHISVIAPLTVVVDPPFAFKVASASVRWSKKLLGDVTLTAFLDAPLPAPAEVVSVTFDGIPLVNVPFSEFRQRPNGSWRYVDAGLVVHFDPAAQTLVVSTPAKTNLATLDNSNGVTVELCLGDRTVVETITMTPDKTNRLVYTAPVP